jgi:8-oxo-dGTP pyrophosphatase MutT (NUDIX family)
MIDYKNLDGMTVCICAPPRARREVVEVEARLGLAGATALAPVPSVGETSRAVTTALHHHKISEAHAVIVANPGGYVGPGTAQEISYAIRHRVPVMFLVDPPVIELAPEQYAAVVSRSATKLVIPTGRDTAGITSGALVTVTDGTGARRAWCHAVQARSCADLREAGPAASAPIDSDESGDRFVAVEIEFLGEPDPSREQTATRRRTRPRSAAGAALLLRDADGRVLLVQATGWPGGWRLPGAVVEGGEYPREAAGRGAAHLLGVPLITASILGATLLPARDLLVVDHLDEESDAETRTEYVYDGGVIDLEHAQHVQAVTAGTSRAGLVEPAEVATLVAPRLARRIGAALARLADPGAPVAIERGFPPGHGTDWEWRDGDRFPPGMPIRQVSVWAFDPDGRVLLQHRVAQHRFALPGGRPEPSDQSLIATGAREALEESQIVIDTDRAVVFGYQTT